MKKMGSYDFILILATAIVLFLLSAICIYGMFYFKLAEVQNMAPALKGTYMDKMNSVIAPFITALLLLLGICVPKRLLSTRHLNFFAILLAVIMVGVSLFRDVKTGLLVILFASLILQVIVLALAVAGSDKIHFTKTSYWLRVGSSCMHLGLILFVLDLFFHKNHSLHIVLFWITTATTVAGMTFCFYADSFLKLFGYKLK